MHSVFVQKRAQSNMQGVSSLKETRGQTAQKQHCQHHMRIQTITVSENTDNKVF